LRDGRLDYTRGVDETTRRVEELYAAFPYPSPKDGGQNLKELRGLLTIFAAENRYSFKGKRVLDAGTGTGHRLIEAAKALPDTQFVAVDISEPPLEIARRTAAAEGVGNVEFLRCNLMDDGAALGAFDAVLCMGVLHHLSDPARGLRNLTRNLAPGGLLFLYIYGAHGGRERMRRKQIVSLLQGGASGDFTQGIRLVKELGFDSFEYGWNLNAEDEASRNTLIVDAYLHVNEKLFDAGTIFELMRTSGLHAFATYGLTLAQRGCLFDARYGKRGMIESVAVEKHLKSKDLKEAYEKLPLAQRYRLIDLLFEPNGYTLLGLEEGALSHFAPEGRVAANLLRIADL
jgi:SAM-dependent methyltransferase